MGLELHSGKGNCLYKGMEIDENNWSVFRDQWVGWLEGAESEVKVCLEGEPEAGSLKVFRNLAKKSPPLRSQSEWSYESIYYMSKCWWE